jgi:hypothetical protein
MFKNRIHQEDAKTRQTSHWDWDYLPLAELERLGRRQQALQAAREGEKRASDVRRILAWICLAAGVALLAALAVIVWIWSPGLS